MLCEETNVEYLCGNIPKNIRALPSGECERALHGKERAMTKLFKNKIRILIAMVGIAVVPIWAKGSGLSGSDPQQNLVQVAIAKDNDLSNLAEVPYKATNIEDCIHEKECVWYEFSKLITQSNLEKKELWRLSRWETPLQIKIIEDDGHKYQQNIHETIEILDKYFPGKISISDKKINFFIAFQTSIKDDFYNSDYDFWKGIFKQSITHIEQAINVNEQGDSHCVQVSMHNDQLKNIVGVLFVEKGHPETLTCIRKGLKSALTAPYSSQPYLAKYNAEKFADHKINKLDLFLQALLYDPNFQTNMTFSQVDSVFDQAYPDTLNRFKDQLERQVLP